MNKAKEEEREISEWVEKLPGADLSVYMPLRGDLDHEHDGAAEEVAWTRARLVVSKHSRCPSLNWKICARGFCMPVAFPTQRKLAAFKRAPALLGWHYIRTTYPLCDNSSCHHRGPRRRSSFYSGPALAAVASVYRLKRDRSVDMHHPSLNYGCLFLPKCPLLLRLFIFVLVMLFRTPRPVFLPPRTRGLDVARPPGRPSTGQHGAPSHRSREREAAEAGRDRRLQPPPGREGEAEEVRHRAEPAGLQETRQGERGSAEGWQAGRRGCMSFGCLAEPGTTVWCTVKLDKIAELIFVGAPLGFTIFFSAFLPVRFFLFETEKPTTFSGDAPPVRVA